MAQFAGFVVFTLSVLSFGFCMTPSPVVVTTNGTVIGVDDTASGVQKFLGIPFAEPPVGSYRLRQSVALKNSFGTIHADTFGHACLSARVEANGSEDCLTLNIWRPNTPNGKGFPLPVLVWLYGGGLTSGHTVR